MTEGRTFPKLLAGLAILNIICTNQNLNTQLEMKLSSEETVIFIRLVKKYQLLWNSKHPDYKNKEKQLSTWNKIATYFRAQNGLEAYGKYRRLRSLYTNTLSRLHQGKIVEKPKMQFFHEMDFLRSVVEEQMQQKTVDKQIQDTIEADKELREDGSSQTDESVQSVGTLKEETTTKMTIGNNEHVEPYWRKPNNTFEERSSNNADNHTENNDNYSDSSSESLVTAKSFIENATVQQQITALEHNQFDAFAVHIASQLREMDMVSALELMSDIQSKVTEKRLILLRKQEPKKRSSKLASYRSRINPTN